MPIGRQHNLFIFTMLYLQYLSLSPLELYFAETGPSLILGKQKTQNRFLFSSRFPVRLIGVKHAVIRFISPYIVSRCDLARPSYIKIPLSTYIYPLVVLFSRDLYLPSSSSTFLLALTSSSQQSLLKQFILNRVYSKSIFFNFICLQIWQFNPELLIISLLGSIPSPLLSQGRESLHIVKIPFRHFHRINFFVSYIGFCFTNKSFAYNHPFPLYSTNSSYLPDHLLRIYPCASSIFTSLFSII